MSALLGGLLKLPLPAGSGSANGEPPSPRAVEGTPADEAPLFYPQLEDKLPGALAALMMACSALRWPGAP